MQEPTTVATPFAPSTPMLRRLIVSWRIRSSDAAVRRRMLDKLVSMDMDSPPNSAWAGRVGLGLLRNPRIADTGVEIFRRVRPAGFARELFDLWVAEFVNSGGGYASQRWLSALDAVVSPDELASILQYLSKPPHYLLPDHLCLLVASCVRNFPTQSLQEISSLVKEGHARRHANDLRTGLVRGFTDETARNGEGVFRIGDQHLTYILDGLDVGGQVGEFFADVLREIEESKAILDHKQLQAVVPKCFEKLRHLSFPDPGDPILASSIIGILAMLKADEAILRECRDHPDDWLWRRAATSMGVRNHGGAPWVTGFFERLSKGTLNEEDAELLFRAISALLEQRKLRPDGEEVSAALRDLDFNRLLSAAPLSTLDLASLAMCLAVGESLEQVTVSLLRHTGQPYVRELMALLLRRYARRVTDEHLKRMARLSDRDTRTYKEVHYDGGDWRLHQTGGELYDFQVVRSLADAELMRRQHGVWQRGRAP